MVVKATADFQRMSPLYGILFLIVTDTAQLTEKWVNILLIIKKLNTILALNRIRILKKA